MVASRTAGRASGRAAGPDASHSGAMIAILGGLGAAAFWAIATLASSRAGRRIGPSSTLAWVMVVGLLLGLPAALVASPGPVIDDRSIGWLALAGFANAIGLLLVYRGLRIGKVGIVAALASTQGAIAAVLAVVAGETLAPGAAILLAVVATGVAIVAGGADGTAAGHDPAAERRAVIYGIAGAACFGLGLFALARASIALSPWWAVLPARIVGTGIVTVPLALVGRLRLTRAALPLVVVGGLGELVGSISFGFGARDGIAVAAVLASQFAAIAAIGAFFLFHERVTVRQRLGVAVVAVGVAVLTALQA
jgi:drug/metabolite transporter (DMT)-like permease